MTEETTFKQRLLAEIDEAIEENIGLEILVTAPGMPRLEAIINPTENLPYKRAYYDSAYDDDLCLKNNKEIKIIAFSLND